MKKIYIIMILVKRSPIFFVNLMDRGDTKDIEVDRENDQVIS